MFPVSFSTAFSRQFFPASSADPAFALSCFCNLTLKHFVCFSREFSLLQSSPFLSSSVAKLLNLFLSWNWNPFLMLLMLSMLVSYLLTACLFLFALLRFSKVLAMTKLWSLAALAPLYARTSCTELLNIEFTAMWSIWLCSARWDPSVFMYIYLCAGIKLMQSQGH